MSYQVRHFGKFSSPRRSEYVGPHRATILWVTLNRSLITEDLWLSCLGVGSKLLSLLPVRLNSFVRNLKDELPQS